MVRTRVLAVLVGCLLLGAGCQSLGSDRQTVTPAAVPAADGSGVVDADGVTDRHRAALENRSHTTQVTLAVHYENGTVGRVTDEFVVGSDDRYRYDRRQNSPFPEDGRNYSVWYNGTTERVREATANGSTVVVQSGSGLTDPSLAVFLERLLGEFELTVTEAATAERVTGEADRARNIPLPIGLHDSRNATVTATVRADIVRSLTVDLTADYPAIDQSVRVEIEYTVEGVGETDPSPPTWVEADG